MAFMCTFLIVEVNLWLFSSICPISTGCKAGVAGGLRVSDKYLVAVEENMLLIWSPHKMKPDW